MLGWHVFVSNVLRILHSHSFHTFQSSLKIKQKKKPRVLIIFLSSPYLTLGLITRKKFSISILLYRCSRIMDQIMVKLSLQNNGLVRAFFFCFYCEEWEKKPFCHHKLFHSYRWTLNPRTLLLQRVEDYFSFISHRLICNCFHG